MNIPKLELKRSLIASTIVLSAILLSWTDIVVAQENSSGHGNGNGNDCICANSGGQGAGPSDGKNSGHGILIPNSELDGYTAAQRQARFDEAERRYFKAKHGIDVNNPPPYGDKP